MAKRTGGSLRPGQDQLFINPAQLSYREDTRVALVRVQRVHQRRSFQHQPNPRVAMAVDPPLVTLRQPEPALQIEVVHDLFEPPLAHEEPVKKAEHHRRHVVTDRIFGRLEAVDQLFEPLLASRAILRPGFERRGHRLDDRDILPDDLLLLLDFVQSAPDASGQAAELLLGEPPFFSSKFRWSDAWTSFKASAILRPVG